MRSSVHDTLVRFRWNGEFVEAANEKARAQGMTFSELARQALRRELQGAQQ